MAWTTQRLFYQTYPLTPVVQQSIVYRFDKDTVKSCWVTACDTSTNLNLYSGTVPSLPSWISLQNLLRCMKKNLFQIFQIYDSQMKEGTDIIFPFVSLSPTWNRQSCCWCRKILLQVQNGHFLPFFFFFTNLA